MAGWMGNNYALSGLINTGLRLNCAPEVLLDCRGIYETSGVGEVKRVSYASDSSARRGLINEKSLRDNN